ncbi:MAG: hypothetical protein PHY75_05385 [Bacteroidales bacterium]|nr:hypothetical protein [Bacteroidales bacterium]
MNRIKLNLPKDHHYDAVCIGKSTPEEIMFKTDNILYIKALGRGSYSRTTLNKYGFPRAYLPRQKYFFGFQSGDMVKAIVPKGKYKGTWFGSVACRSNGSFNINLKNGRIQGINHKYCQTIQRFDGYKYIIKRRGMDLAHSPHLNECLPVLNSVFNMYIPNRESFKITKIKPWVMYFSVDGEKYFLKEKDEDYEIWCDLYRKPDMEIISSFGGHLSSIVVPKKESTPYNQINIDQIIFNMTWYELVDSYMREEVQKRKVIYKKCDKEIKKLSDSILLLKNRQLNIMDIGVNV